MDTLTRWLLPKTGIKISFICATETLKTAQKKHTTLTSSSVALGRAMMGVLCLAAEEKDATRIQLHLASDGAIKTVVVDASNEGHVRGYVGNPLVSQKTHHEREMLEDALGNRGHASLFRRPEEGAFTQSTVPLRSGEVDEDLEAILKDSTQVHAAYVGDVLMEEGLFVKQAYGFFVSALPETILADPLAAFAEYKRMFLDALSRTDLKMGDDKVQQAWLLEQFQDEVPQQLDQRPVAFQCTCSQARISKAMEAMPTSDIEEMAQEGDQTITCDFCNTNYIVSKPELDAMCQ
jgi:molecular chaperone Hsp33